MRILLLLAVLALSACASTTLNSVKESSVAYEMQVQGNHAELAECIADALEDHKKFLVRAQEYAVRNYPEKSEIQAYSETTYGGNVYLFTIELQQKDKETVQVMVRNIEAFKEFVEGPLQSCSAKS